MAKRKYLVGMTESHGSVLVVEAETPDEAQQKAAQDYEENGVGNWNPKWDEVDFTEACEIKDEEDEP